MVKNPSVMQETQIQFLDQEDPLQKEWLSIPLLLTGEYHGQKNLVDHSPWHHKVLDMTERLMLSCLCEVPRIIQFIETESRIVLAGIVRKGMGSYYLMGRKFQFAVMRKFWRGMWWWLHKNINAFTATEFKT